MVTLQLRLIDKGTLNQLDIKAGIKLIIRFVKPKLQLCNKQKQKSNANGNTRTVRFKVFLRI